MAIKSAQSVIGMAIRAEMAAPSADDRRIISDERIKLQSRMQLAKAGRRSQEEVAAQARETERVVAMWGSR